MWETHQTTPVGGRKAETKGAQKTQGGRAGTENSERNNSQEEQLSTKGLKIQLAWKKR